jgi:hypothetical protein
MTPGAAGIALFGACSHPASPPASPVLLKAQTPSRNHDSIPQDESAKGMTFAVRLDEP